MDGMRAQRGVTLVELMITIAVAAILMALAAPSFESVLNRNRLAATSNELVASMQLARMEATRRGVHTVMCRTADANAANPTCTTADGNWAGWIVFVDDGAGGGSVDGQHQAGERVLGRHEVASPMVVRPSPAIGTASSRIVFRADGTARTSSASLLTATIAVCLPTTSPGENVRDVVLRSGSQTSIDPRNGGGACGAPSNPS